MSFLEEECDIATVDFIPTRDMALERLKAFAPFSGGAYASSRNFDLGPDNRSNISMLSPWVRHRLISEEEILAQTLHHHSFRASEKFLQEVFWRAYFKGWLEQRPDVWRWYKQGVLHGINQLEKDGSLNQRYQTAIAGKTGIEAFDFWARELVETGYLHNHARMWFASIWIFTLKLPWELGADFFYRHLMDGDAASNTCSWRWVGGLHTKGKNYAASASNIERFTNGRFASDMELARNPMPLEEMGDAPIIPVPLSKAMPDKPYVLFVTQEDCLPETLPLSHKPNAILGLLATQVRSPLGIGEKASAFSNGAVQDALNRAQAHFECDATLNDTHEWTQTLKQFAGDHGVDTIVTAYAPVGPIAEKLEETREELSKDNIHLVQILRDYDAMTWPHATKGFFKLKKMMPKFLGKLGLA